MRSVPFTVHPGVRFDHSKLVDLYCPAASSPPVVLLWHGSGPNERNVLRPLARAIASNGIAVVVPDWQADDERARRAQLIASISFVLAHSDEFGWSSQVVVGGWSFGASAAVDLVLHPEIVDDWRPTGCLGIAGPYDVSPLRNALVCDDLTVDATVPFLLVHGAGDETVPIARSRELHRLLSESGWPSALHELDTNHAGIIGTRYAPLRRRCVETADVGAMRMVASLVADYFLLADGQSERSNQ